VKSIGLDSRENALLEIALLAFLLILAVPAAAQDLRASHAAREQQASEPNSEEQIQVPNRPPKALFEGAEGKQRTEIHFDPATHMVTLKLLVQDPNGYFIPNIRRENFVVYENGIRQQNVNVDIEHASVTLGVLAEFGGRTQALNQMMGMEVARAGSQLQNVLGREDKIAVWKYNDKVEKIVDFSQEHATLDQVFADFGEPPFSETNLYDAIIAVLQQMRPVKGRKAIILISTGIDTFSKAKYEDALESARSSDIPIYVIGLTGVLKQLVETHEGAGTLARIDWQKPERELQSIAKVSGGRAYAPDGTIDLSATYDDVMENLRVRYVITYRSSSNLDPNSPRTVRVELVDPKTGGPLEIVDQSGRKIRANLVVQDSYVPNAAAVGHDSTQLR
jgi:VWFA-related protein